MHLLFTESKLSMTEMSLNENMASWKIIQRVNWNEKENLQKIIAYEKHK